MFLALFWVILTILLHLGTLWFVDPAGYATLKSELPSDPSKLITLIAIPFDLWVVALSVIAGAHLAVPKKKTEESDKEREYRAERRERIGSGIFWTMVSLALILASVSFSRLDPSFHPDLFMVYLPDLWCIGLLAFNTYAAGESA